MWIINNTNAWWIPLRYDEGRQASAGRKMEVLYERIRGAAHGEKT